MRLTGQHLIGGEILGCAQQGFQAFDPYRNLSIEPSFCEADADIVDRAARLAGRDFDAYRMLDPAQRGHFLEVIGDELQLVKAPLAERAHKETGLPIARLEAELGRTITQLELFARQLQTGGFAQVEIESAQPHRTPVPKPDIRKSYVALGPVAVFGASNFPLAFSVAGGDTVSALAAGCPVIVKAHPAHPGTSELAGRAICRAVQKTGMPEGTFSLVQGRSHLVGQTLVQHPLIKAVAFTGSLAGGRALFDLAAVRPGPIPVYAEMGSVNPVFVLPQVLQDGFEGFAGRFAESVTLGVGQFCTKPGLLIALQDAGLDALTQEVSERLFEQSPAPMLHPGIKENFLRGLERLSAVEGVSPVGHSLSSAAQGCLVAPALFKTTSAVFLQHESLSDEVFGPVSLIVACDSFAEMLAVAQHLKGQLTATVHAGAEEYARCKELYRILERKAGRLLLNDFPTGVEVCPAMNHGGPYPASTDSRSTSVGTAAIERFLRPICYQNFALELLPDELKS